MTQTRATRLILRAASKLHQTAFAVACAERTAPVFHRLAAPESVMIYDDCLRAAWNAVNKGASVATRQRELLAALPEAEIEDSHCPDYYASGAIEVLQHALDSLDASGAFESADCASSQALEIYSSFDAIALKSPNLIVDPDNPHPPGQLESAELNEQSESLRILREGHGSEVAACERLRERAKSASQTLDSAVSLLVKSRK